jgi:ribosomal-protein-alanine N-acetyltransferase
VHPLCHQSTSRTHRSMPERPPFTVEPMTLDDIDQVMEIEQIVFPAPWSARAYQYEITKNDHSTMLVVRAAGTSKGRLGHLKYRLGLGTPSPVLGYAGLWLLVDETHICTSAVHPRWQGLGLGELLLVSLLDESMRLGALCATLEVRVSNSAAQALYLKYGFEIVSIRKRYYTDNNEDAYIMTTPSFDTAGFQKNLDSHRHQLHARLQLCDLDPIARSDAPRLVHDRQALPTHE